MDNPVYLWNCKECNDLIMDMIWDDEVTPEKFRVLIEDMVGDHVAYHLVDESLEEVS